jgi:hypothetical protein
MKGIFNRYYLDLDSLLPLHLLDLHGGPAVESAAWSLRIDGKFTMQFKQRLKDAYGTTA